MSHEHAFIFHGLPPGATVHLHLPDEQERVLCRLAEVASSINQLEQIMGQQLDQLKAEVARNTAVDESVITLVNGLAAKIEAAKEDPAAIQALADELRNSSDKVADVVTKNTPAETPPAEVPST